MTTTYTSAYQDMETGTKCLICDKSNTPDAILCAECSAPMAIAHDSIAQEREPQIVSIVGESNVGKTVYLGVLLDMLSQRAGDFQAIPKGAYSIDLQQTVISHLAHRMFPPKTPMEANEWYWAYYQVLHCKSGKWIDLAMPDMAGESLAAEVASPQTFQIIRNLLTKSAGTIMLVDAALAANGSTQPDFFSLKMMSYLDTMHAAKRDQKIKRPLAIVLCKSDHCPECFDEPGQFVKANLNRLWNMCESRFERVEFFATSVIGSLAYATVAQGGQQYVIPVPLHTALRGVLEPFEWVIHQI
jgi:hypothetical protein